MENEIYVVYVESLKNWAGIEISQECYKEKEQAIDFIKTRLTKEELEKNLKAQKRGLQSWYEFFGKNYIYNVKVLSLR